MKRAGWRVRVSLASSLAAALVFSCGCASEPTRSGSTEPRGVPGGIAEGSFVVSGNSTPIRQAYLVRLRPNRRAADELHLILSDRSLPAAALDDPRELAKLALDGDANSVDVVLSIEGSPIESRFHHGALPSGLSVGGAPKVLKLSGLPDGPVTGSYVFDDDKQSSWSANVNFEARLRRVEPKRLEVASDASPAQRARAALEADAIAFTETVFLDRCFSGDLDAVTLFLEAGMSARTRSGRRSALSHAISRPSVDVARALLAAGADPNEKIDEYGTTLLHQVVDTGNAELVSAFLEAGAVASVANQYRMTPLMSAALEGKLEIVRLLVAHGAKVTARNTAGGTALSSAVLRGHLDVAKELIAAGADVERDRKDLLELARQGKNKAMEKLIAGAAGQGKKGKK